MEKCFANNRCLSSLCHFAYNNNNYNILIPFFVIKMVRLNCLAYSMFIIFILNYKGEIRLRRIGNKNTRFLKYLGYNKFHFLS